MKRHQRKSMGVIIDSIQCNAFVQNKYQKGKESRLLRQGGKADIYT